MKNDFRNRIIHVVNVVIFFAQVIQKFIHEIIPNENVTHLGDDSIQMTNNVGGMNI